MPSLVVEACSVLGVDPGPDGTPPEEDVIAAAFKKLAIRWHPDRNPDNVKEATQRFAEISAARDLLLDPPTNALIDEPKAHGVGATATCVFGSRPRCSVPFYRMQNACALGLSPLVYHVRSDQKPGGVLICGCARSRCRILRCSTPGH